MYVVKLLHSSFVTEYHTITHHLSLCAIFQLKLGPSEEKADSDKNTYKIAPSGPQVCEVRKSSPSHDVMIQFIHCKFCFPILKKTASSKLRTQGNIERVSIAPQKRGR